MQKPSLVLLALFCIAPALAIAAGIGPSVISQQSRSFAPGAVTIARGGTITIVNDDKFLHHAFLDDPRFSFDSGEQEVGSRTEVTFPSEGTFEVRCEIHPKMRLVVTVE